MAIKGQKFKSYSDEIKKEAIRLHVEENGLIVRLRSIFSFKTKGE